MLEGRTRRNTQAHCLKPLAGLFYLLETPYKMAKRQSCTDTAKAYSTNTAALFAVLYKDQPVAYAKAIRKQER
jgi:hypothetical protein